MYIITLKENDNNKVNMYINDSAYTNKNESLRIWNSEKAAIQFIDRWALKLEKPEDIKIIKTDGSAIFRILEVPEKPVYHKWRKANVLNLGDKQGKYNKLVCENCGKIVRHYYERNRHFREEYQCCNGVKK